MTVFHFHKHDGSVERDAEGTELPDIMTARIEAVKLTGAMMRDDPELIASGHDIKVEVTDQTGQLLFTVVGHASAAAEGTTKTEPGR